MVNWVSNSQRLLNKLNNEKLLKEPSDIILDKYHTEKILGLCWNPWKDAFVFQCKKC